MPTDTSPGKDFEPPKYLASLIAAINDGAKAAQAGMLLFMLVGLYLLATAFSASDEDILLGRTVTISQIGASLPVSFSFALAPLVFVFLHVYALTRYDMLGTNVRYFVDELDAAVPLRADQERCRQLLANVEFVQALTAPFGSSLRSRFWPVLAVAMMAGFPVVVLFLVQINSLRYQSDTINWVQRAWLLIDVLSIVAFFARNKLNGQRVPYRSWFDPATRWNDALLCLAVLVLGLNLAWLNVVSATADEHLVRYDALRWRTADAWRGGPPTWSEVVGQPLDVVLCPLLKWGCRYLQVEHRTLVDHVWDNKAMAALRSDGVDHAEALAGIEGVVLRERNLRFSVLDDSRLYGADLTGADLSKARLIDARLLSVKLDWAILNGAFLDEAQLQGASLNHAWIQGASLDVAHLQGASLDNAHLQGASLVAAELQGASFGAANLKGAVLAAAQLQGALLGNAQFQGANLSWANLQGASLAAAQLQGARLYFADLQGASLQFAQLQGASLNFGHLHGASLSDVFVWRTSASIDEVPDAMQFTLRGVITGPQRACTVLDHKEQDPICNWSRTDFKALKQEISTTVTDKELREAALEKIRSTLNPAIRDDDRIIGEEWLRRQALNPATSVVEEARAAVWKKVGCAAAGAPFVVAALAGRLANGSPWDFSEGSPHPAELAATFLDEKTCAGAQGISAVTRAQLEALRKPAAPPSAKP